MNTQHDCVKRLNEKLEVHNSRIAQAISFGEKPRELIQVTTVKVNSTKRGKPPVLFASYCPFCGVKLEGVSA